MSAFGSLRSSVSELLSGRSSGTLEQRNARYLMVSAAWLGFIDGGIGTYLSVLLVRLGATPGVMSLLSSGPQLVNMLSLMPAGAFVERQGNLVKLANRSVFLYRSTFVLIAALPLLLPPEQIPMAVVIISSLAVVPAAIQMPALMAIIQRTVPPERRPSVNGTRWAGITVVAAIAIPVMGYMIDHTAFPVGYQIAFLISFLGTLPNFYFFSKIRMPPFQRSAPAGEQLTSLQRLRRFATPFFESRRFVRFNLATGAFRICLSMPAGLYSIYWVDYLDASDTLIGIRGAVAYAALAFAYWMWARVTNRIGHRRLLIISALIGFYPITTGLAPSAGWLLLAAVIWGLFVAAIDIGFVDMLLLACPEGRQPTFVAAANILSSAENFAGPLIGAALAHVIGVQAALIVAGVLTLGSCGFFVLLPSKQEEHAAHAQQATPTAT